MSFRLDVDPASATPIWRQIEDGVRRLVASGVIPSGDSVPSVRELARTLRVNPATVSKAYQLLVDDGLLTVRRGEGTFVAELSEEGRRRERARLLGDGARRFVATARSVAASRSEARRAIDGAWDEHDTGEEGTLHEG